MHRGPAIAFPFVLRRDWWASSFTCIRCGRATAARIEDLPMISALLMWRRFTKALRYAMREEDFAPVLSAGGVLIVIGTFTYTLGNGWKLVDGLYFAVATLTTSSIADSDLVLRDSWMKVFTVLYVLIGIGILVEIVRRLGFAFVEVQRQEKGANRGGP
jgi:Ion channel